VDDEIKDLKVRGRLYEVDMVLPARTMMMRTISAFFRSYNFEDLTSEDLTLKYKELKTELITITTIVDKTSCGPVGGG
jgi:aspartyl/asparaginyl-tRNA synthetase